MAILPSPVFAALPSYNSGTNSGSFTVTNGSVSTTSGTGIVQSSDRAVLVWNQGQFNIATGETFNFQVPGGSVLNKVGYTTSGADTATIAGTLISSGRVFVLANGDINLAGTANVSTQGGLMLSTLAETSDFNYTTTGNLALTGAPQGNVSLGDSSGRLFVSNGGASAWGNVVSVNNVRITGDLVVASRGYANITNGTGQSLMLTGSGGNTEVTGSLNASTTNGTIGQNSSQPLLVSGTTVLSTGSSGSASINLTTNTVAPTNDFTTVSAATGASSSVKLDDKNSIVLNTSVLGGSLNVLAVNNITTSGAVAVGGTVDLKSIDTTATNKIEFSTGSSAVGLFSANVANGTITANTVGNLTTGLITTGGGGLDAAIISSGGSGYTGQPTVVISGGGGTNATANATVSGGVVTGVIIDNPGTGYTSAPTITFVGGGPNPSSAATATVRISSMLNDAPNTVINTTLSGGAGYNTLFPPDVIVTGGGGTGASVLGTWLNGVLISVTVVNQGSGYTSSPTLALNGVAGVDYPFPVVPIGTISLPLAPVGVSLGNVTGGNGYTGAPTITISGGGGLGATANVVIANQAPGPLPLTSMNITNAGSNYTTSPIATLSGGGTSPTSTASGSLTSAPNGGNVSISSTGVVSLLGNVNGGNITVTAPSISSTSGTVASNGTVTYNATAGNLVVGTTNARNLALTVAGGNITQTGALAHISSGVSTPTTVIKAGTGDVTLAGFAVGNTTVPNSLKGIVQLEGNNVALTNSGAITLGTTNTKGNLTVTTTSGGQGIAFGTGFGTAAQNVTVGGNLNLATSGGNITDDSYANQYVFGNTTITTNGGTVALNAAAASSNGATGRFGQFNVNAGSGEVTVSENTAMNIGNVTAGRFTARSMNSDVVINGNVTVTANWGGNINNTTATSVRANGNITQAATSTLALSGSSSFETVNTAGVGTSLTSVTNNFAVSNNATYAVRIINGGENNIVSGSQITANLGNVTSGNVKVSTVNAATGVIYVGVTGGNGGNATNVTISSADRVVITGGTYRNLTVSAASIATNAITQNNVFTVNNTLNLSTPGGISIASGTANISAVVLNNVVGNSTIYSSRDMTVSGNAAGMVDVGAGMGSGANTSYVGPWNLTLGKLNVGSLIARASNHGGNVTTNGTSGVIRQASGTGVHVERDADFQTYNNDIVIGNNGNSFGKVSLSTGGGYNTAGMGNVTLVEDSSMRIGNVNTNGTLTLTSRFGSILEDPNADVNVSAKGLVTLNAPAGSVALGNSIHTTGNTTGDISAVTINAAGAAQVISTNNVVLGAVNANSLLVGGNVITQSAPVRIYGASVLNSKNGILLTDAGNNFGPITANTVNANTNISIVEGSTLNLRSVNMPGAGNGTVTVNSIGGDVIDTGLGGVKLGGNSTTTGTGLVTLTAGGNILIDDPTSDFRSSAGVVFNGKDVTLSVLGNNGTAIIVGSPVAASAASGNLVVSNALGNIGNGGAFTVGGNAYFQASNGSIIINQPGVGFGTLKFIGQQVNIAEAGNMDILTGSSASSLAQLYSGGAISVVDAGGVVSFNSTASFTASGNITLTKTQAINTISVNSAGTKDLSALSLAADLNSKNPIDLGTGPGPSTNPALAPKP